MLEGINVSVLKDGGCSENLIYMKPSQKSIIEHKECVFRTVFKFAFFKERFVFLD